MAESSDFPTTPTTPGVPAAGAAPAAGGGWAPTTPLPLEDPAGPPAPAPRRAVDPVSLVPGLLFVVLAVVGLTGAELPLGVFRDGGVLWVLLIGAGLWLLVGELRRSRRRR
ncbi:hypothetical protein [Blastococcus sp. SYSU D00695]